MQNIACNCSGTDVPKYDGGRTQRAGWDGNRGSYIVNWAVGLDKKNRSTDGKNEPDEGLLTRRISYKDSSCTSGPSNASLTIGDAYLFMS